MGFKEYLNYVRLKHAQTALLTTDSSITDIALEYGFNDSNYFKDLFKKFTESLLGNIGKSGLTPDLPCVFLKESSPEVLFLCMRNFFPLCEAL